MAQEPGVCLDASVPYPPELNEKDKNENKFFKNMVRKMLLKDVCSICLN